MRQLLSYFTICLAAATTAVASEDVTIFMPNASELPSERQVAPDTARLILARRLGQPGSSLIGDVDEGIIQDLNEFGGQQPLLFGDSVQKGWSPKLLVILQGLDPIQGMRSGLNIPYAISFHSDGLLFAILDAHVLQRAQVSHITVPAAAPDFMDASFVNSLLAETSRQTPNSRLCTYQWQLDQAAVADLMLRNMEDLGCPLEQPFLKQLTDAMFDRENNVERTQNILHDYLGSAPSTPGQQVSAVLRIRPTPKQKQPLAPREYVSPLLALTQSSVIETILVTLPGSKWNTSPPSSQKPAVQPRSRHHSHKRHSSHLSPILHRDSNTTKPNNTLSTLLPICYATNETCTARTNSCSGNGYCYLKRHSPTKGSECYACKCLRTLDYTNPDGTQKTIQWGGPACQKKDVSMPFWLLAGLSVLLVVGIWFGVGLLWAMGQEELPGVLSAGVAAPRTQK
ncbi:hypothetical protein PRK78_003994 [Emydomyces testavorans]|uniref:Vacuolar sorting protein Vps3844 C-terminal domain-containing protein n=1 Tax=Emydomyces testavorans TaxID=2070801 RepID=A0AAF0IJB2_9EURO|nr:hypothetical protein PRK78_003994 [Emydomyces testavorans]